MAEASLYENFLEPVFPYDAISEFVQWIPLYVDHQTPKRGRNIIQGELYSILINVILVFARARTSAFFGNEHRKVIQDFVKRLNSSLGFLCPGNRALYHKVEIVLRGNAGIFITCFRSPRFIWNYRLTHREIGLNLDYAAAGHIGRSNGPKLSFRLYEISHAAHCHIVGEIVHLDFVSDLSALQSFNQKKTELFNFTMSRLKLPYRFEGFWRSSSSDADLQRVMRSNRPPSLNWWMANYIFLSDLPYAMAFCSRTCRFQAAWEILQVLYDFVISLHQSLSPLPIEYSAEVEQLFQHVYESIDSRRTTAVNPEENSCLIYDSPSEFQALLEEVTMAVSRMATDPAALCQRDIQIPDGDTRRSDIQCFLDRVTEWMRMCMFQRWKRRNPLQSSILEQWPDVGDKIYPFEPPWARRKILGRIKDIFLPRKMLA